MGTEPMSLDGVIGQLHAHNVFPPGKEPPAPVCKWWHREDPCPYQGSNSCHLAWRQSLY